MLSVMQIVPKKWAGKDLFLFLGRQTKREGESIERSIFPILSDVSELRRDIERSISMLGMLVRGASVLQPRKPNSYMYTREHVYLA